jgi:cobalt-zinc-cadmium efflux system protein
MAHAHRETAASRSRGRLGAALVLTGGFMIVEVAGALWTGSLALAADAAHMLTDAGGLGLALFAIWIAARPPTPEKTYGYYRVEILAAMINALVLMFVAGALLVEAYQRIRAPRDVLGGPMMAVAAAGLLVNLTSAALLHGGSAGSLNVRAAYLEVVADAITSVGVLVTAAVVTATGWSVADPIMSAAIAIFIVPRTWSLLRQAINVLLEAVPAHLALEEVESAIVGVPGVLRLHDLHVWTLTSGRDAMSAHVVVEDLAASERLLDELHAVLHARFGIDHTTIQLEKAPPPVLRIKGPGL